MSLGATQTSDVLWRESDSARATTTAAVDANQAGLWLIGVRLDVAFAGGCNVGDGVGSQGKHPHASMPTVLRVVKV